MAKRRPPKTPTPRKPTAEERKIDKAERGASFKRSHQDKKNAHHCPKEFKGGCRNNVKTPAGQLYCAVHEMFCHEHPMWTFIKGVQNCPVCDQEEKQAVKRRAEEELKKKERERMEKEREAIEDEMERKAADKLERFLRRGKRAKEREAAKVESGRVGKRGRSVTPKGTRGTSGSPSPKRRAKSHRAASKGSGRSTSRSSKKSM